MLLVVSADFGATYESTLLESNRGIRRSMTLLDRLHARARREMPGLVANLALGALKGLLGGKGAIHAEWRFVHDKLIPIDRGQGWLIYMLCRGLQARRVVEFGTSYGVSTLYLAAAMRDQGGGLVIGTEIETEKARHAPTIPGSLPELPI